MSGLLRRWLWAAVLIQAGAGHAQDTGPVHDAPYVPTPPAVVEEMLRLAGVGPEDVVYDLGAGDGRIVIAAAARFGARGVGIERDAQLVARARESARAAGVAGRVRFLQQDLFAADLSEATVVTLYLSPNLNQKLLHRLAGLKPGTRIVSHASGLGDWRPDRKVTVRKDVLLWIVPAQVAGRWQAWLGTGRRGLELDITQRFQEISAVARLDAGPVQVWEARISGDRLSFVIVDGAGTESEVNLYFEGRVRGGAISGTVARGAGRLRAVEDWVAARP